MTAWELAIGHAVKVLVLVTIAGVFARRYYRLSWAFLAYLVAILIFNCLATFWPNQFYTRSYWLFMQSVWDVAKLAVALEFAYRAFRVFPGARAIARVVVFVVLATTTFVLVQYPAPSAAGSTEPAYTALVTMWHPRILSGTIWLLTATTFLVVWFHLPIHPFQRAVLLGLTPYLLVFTTLLNILRAHGWTIRSEVNLVDGLAYTAVAAWWAYASWRPAENLAAEAAVVRFQMEQV